MNKNTSKKYCPKCASYVKPVEHPYKKGEVRCPECYGWELI